jgi:hypothetical protein
MRALIVFEKGVINLDTSQKDPLVIFEGKKRTVFKLDERDGYYFELVSFVENVKTRTAPEVVTAATAKESLNTVMTEIKSAYKGKRVKVK